MPATPTPPWWQIGVIYQIYPRSFKDSNGDGIGDLGGILEHIDYLSDVLGVDAVWISPFYPSPMKDFGYDVADYTNVDPLFGDLDTFDRLLEAAHRQGLKIIIDYVPNHTSDQHPWFVESRSSRDNPKRDWYVWRDPKPDGAPPNNWLSIFGGPAWTLDEATGQYYLHSFLKEQPDLNWRNPAVKEAMFDVLRFWLDRGVDGFRIDAAQRIMKDPELRDNPPNPDPHGSLHKPHGDYDAQLHLYDKSHPDIHEVFREIRALLDTYEPPRISIAEMHVFEWEQWARFFGEKLDEMHLPTNFGLLKTPWRATAVRALVDAIEAAVPDGAWPNYVIGNHDESRLASRIGRAQARVAAVLLLTVRGTPTLYYGDELGMLNVPIPEDRVQDPWGLQVKGLGLGRDPARTPMPWDDTPSAGFSAAPPDELWLPLGDEYTEVNVARLLADPTSLLNLYRSLLRLRRSFDALQIGTYRPVDDVPEPLFVYFREHEDERVLIVLNFTSDPVRFCLPNGMPSARLLLSTDPAREEQSFQGTLPVSGDEALLLIPDQSR